MLKLFLVNVGIINAIDIKRAQVVIVDCTIRLIVAIPQCFKEIHINDRCPGGYNRIHHAEFHQITVNMHTTPGGG